MKHNRRPSHKPIQVQPLIFVKGAQNMSEKRQPLEQTVLEKLHIYM
jgi:hypothetical protein